MKTHATRKQMEIRAEEAEFKKQYAFWSTLPFNFRVVSFNAQKELEQDNEVKSITYRVLADLTQ